MGLHRYVSLTCDEDCVEIIDWAYKNLEETKNQKTAKKFDFISYLFFFSNLEDVSWYDIVEDLKLVTETFPDKKFMIEVEEGSGERWRLYAWKGEIFIVESHLVWDSAPFEFV